MTLALPEGSEALVPSIRRAGRAVVQVGSITDFRSAESKAEALAWLEELGSEAQVLAGGTDVMIQYSRGELRPRALIHVEKVTELRGMQANGRLEMGCLTTHLELVQSPLSRQFPALAEAARTVGGWQTQAVGTVGGNIANASPAADLVPPLLVADAQVFLEASSGTRALSIGDFITGRRQTELAPNELITGLSIEPAGPGVGEVYLKVGRRGAMEVAIAGLAVRLALDDDHAISDARVAVCSVAPRPFRATQAEKVLIGTEGGAEATSDAGALLAASASPIDDVRSLASYRIAVLAPLLTKAIAICKERALEAA